MTGTRSVVVERLLRHPPQKVWRALTQPHLIEQWLMQTDFAPEPGRRFGVTANWGAVECEVLVVEQPHRLSYRWNTKDLESTVTWTLTPTATGTLLRMEQAGFMPGQEAYFRGASVGWPRFLGELDSLLARLD